VREVEARTGGRKPRAAKPARRRLPPPWNTPRTSSGIDSPRKCASWAVSDAGASRSTTSARKTWSGSWSFRAPRSRTKPWFAFRAPARSPSPSTWSGSGCWGSLPSASSSRRLSWGFAMWPAMRHVQDYGTMVRELEALRRQNLAVQELEAELRELRRLQQQLLRLAGIAPSVGPDTTDLALGEPPSSGLPRAPASSTGRCWGSSFETSPAPTPPWTSELPGGGSFWPPGRAWWWGPTRIPFWTTPCPSAWRLSGDRLRQCGRSSGGPGRPRPRRAGHCPGGSGR